MKGPALRNAVLWVPPAAWAAAIYAVSGRPSVPLPGAPGLDLVAHAAAYAVLCILVARPLFAMLRGSAHAVVWTLAVLLCFAYGIADEAHQAFVPGRQCDPADALADLAGAALAVLLVRLAFPRFLLIRLGFPPPRGRL